jgi:hypothetical protein
MWYLSRINLLCQLVDNLLINAMSVDACFAFLFLISAISP